MGIIGCLVAYLFRWFGHGTPSGLRAVGSPTADSPVLITANFSLTVARVLRAVRGLDLWLLIVNSKGINVWCAAGAGELNSHRVVDAVKVARLADRVGHREIILPALSAPAMDRTVIREATGFSARFGPVDAADIPAYLAAGKKKSEAMRRFRFGFRHRLDMFLSLNFVVYAVPAVVLAIFWRDLLPGFSLLFWGAVAFLYLLVDWLPGRSGWGQAFISAALVAGVWAALDQYRLGDPLAHWGWLLATIGIFLLAALDLAGTATGRKPDFELLLHRLGVRSLGSMIKEKPMGDLHFDREACSGCRSCFEICPMAVFGELDGDAKTTLARADACFACGACVRQCPETALRLADL